MDRKERTQADRAEVLAAEAWDLEEVDLSELEEFADLAAALAGGCGYLMCGHCC